MGLREWMDRRQRATRPTCGATCSDFWTAPSPATTARLPCAGCIFPPSAYDPNGVHGAIWARFAHEPYHLPLNEPLTLASYVAKPCPDAYFYWNRCHETPEKWHLRQCGCDEAFTAVQVFEGSAFSSRKYGDSLN